jgi:hypothetical protein
MMLLTRIDPFTGKTNEMTLDVTREQMNEFEKPGHMRRNVQEIFPHLSPDEREFLLTGITPESWDTLK